MKRGIEIRNRARGVSLALAIIGWGLGTATGNIVHTVPAEPIPYPINAQDIDMNGDGVAEFRIISNANGDGILVPRTTETRFVPLADNSLIAVPAPSLNPGSFVAALEPGDLVSLSLNQGSLWYASNTDQFGSALLVGCANLNCRSLFRDGTEAYAGVRFVVAGEVHYGWIRFRSFYSFGGITDWAYETEPGKPIRGGDTGQPMPVTQRIDGSITVVTPNQPIYYGQVGDGTFLHLDLDGDGAADYTLYYDVSRADIRPLRTNSLLVTRSYDDFGPNTGVVLLNAGFIIGPDSTSSNGLQWFDRQLDIYGYAVLGSNLRGLEPPASISSGSPTPDIDAYIGVRFDSAGKTRYGWIHIFKYATVAAGQLFGWAYETRANSPIKAAQVVVTIGDRIEELCPCDGPWRNHGEYVTRMIVVLAQFQKQRVITPTEARAILKEAVQSDCGKPRAPREHQGRTDCERENHAGDHRR